MRIAQILLSPRIGGAESLASALERGWHQSGHESEIFYLDPDDERSRLRLMRLTRALKNYGADAVLSHSALPNIFARLAAPARTPVLTVLHSAHDDFESSKLRWAERALRGRTNAVVAVSADQLAAYVARFGSRVPTAVIANGIRDDLPAKIEYSSTPRTVTTIARVAEQKNPAFWVNVARFVEDLNFQWHGPVTSQPGMADVVASTNVAVTNAQFLPATTDPGVELLQSDIVFHAASREAFSIGLLEAAAVGIPVVCSDSVAESLPSGFPATTFADLDVQSAVAALRRVVTGYPQISDEAAKARAKISSDFGGQRCANLYLDLITAQLKT